MKTTKEINKIPIDKILIILILLNSVFVLVSIPQFYKLSSIGIIKFSTSTLVFVNFYTITDIIAEIYGRRTAIFTMIAILLAHFLASAIWTILIKLPSPGDWHYQSYFDFVLGDTLRSATLACVGVLISQYINIAIITSWKSLVNGKYLFLRMIGATSIGSIAMCTFLYIIFSKTYSPKTSLEMAISAYLLCQIILIIFTPFASFSVYLIKKYKGINEYKTVINPFK